jgi:hypothetical protein
MYSIDGREHESNIMTTCPPEQPREMEFAVSPAIGIGAGSVERERTPVLFVRRQSGANGGNGVFYFLVEVSGVEMHQCANKAVLGWSE